MLIVLQMCLVCRVEAAAGDLILLGTGTSYVFVGLFAMGKVNGSCEVLPCGSEGAMGVPQGRAWQPGLSHQPSQEQGSWGAHEHPQTQALGPVLGLGLSDRPAGGPGSAGPRPGQWWAVRRWRQRGRRAGRPGLEYHSVQNKPLHSEVWPVPWELAFCVLPSMWGDLQTFSVKCFEHRMGTRRADEVAAGCVALHLLGSVPAANAGQLLVSRDQLCGTSQKTRLSWSLWEAAERNKAPQLGLSRKANEKTASLAPSSCLRALLLLLVSLWTWERQCAPYHPPLRGLCRMTPSAGVTVLLSVSQPPRTFFVKWLQNTAQTQLQFTAVGGEPQVAARGTWQWGTCPEGPGPVAIRVPHSISQEAWPLSVTQALSGCLVSVSGFHRETDRNCFNSVSPSFGWLAVVCVFLAWLTRFRGLWRSDTSSDASASQLCSRERQRNTSIPMWPALALAHFNVKVHSGDQNTRPGTLHSSH